MPENLVEKKNFSGIIVEMRYIWVFLILFMVFTINLQLMSQESKLPESWLVPLESLIYKRIEEIFISRGYIPPLEERPVIADELKESLKTITSTANNITKERINILYSDIDLPFDTISPILETSFYAAYTNETGLEYYINTYDREDGEVEYDKRFLDFNSMYQVNTIPSLLNLGLIAQSGGWSILFMPHLRESLSALLADNNITNIPADIKNIDTNFPFRGITTFYSSPIEFRLGRDKLHLGPGRWSTLTLNEYMPYFDYLKARFFIDWFSYSLYFISLNPTITNAENEYLDAMYQDNSNPEPNASQNGKSYIERSKHLIYGKLVLKPFSWLIFSVGQMNLVGGRDLEIFDFNPLLVFHNIYQEGTYSVPSSYSLTCVPLPGIKLYIDYLLYDVSLGDEYDNTKNPTAFAYQGGFTLLSTPFVNLGLGRLRLDGEFTLTDPWIYGKYYNLRKFTSRIIYVEPFVGRFWVDYPLGFHLGPDALDLNLCLAYGVAGSWEIELYWNRNGIGAIDLYGWGEDNDYLHVGEEGYPLTGSPTGTVQWKDTIKSSFYLVPAKDIKFSVWYGFKHIANRYNETGNNKIFHSVGFEALWKIF